VTTCTQSTVRITLKNPIKFILFFLFLSRPASPDVPLGLKGIKGGAAYSNFENTHSEYLQTWLFGIFGEKQLAANAWLVWEANLTTKGGIIKGAPVLFSEASPEQDMYTYDVHCKVRYFEIPVCLKIAIPLSEGFELFAVSGPSISSARQDLSSLENKKIYPGSFESYYDADSKDDFTYDAGPYSSSRLDKSLRMGFQWGVGLKFNRFSIESRYSHLYKDLGNLENIYRVELRTYTVQFIAAIDLFNTKVMK